MRFFRLRGISTFFPLFSVFRGDFIFFSFLVMPTFLHAVFFKVKTGTSLITHSKESQVPSVSGSVLAHIHDKVKKCCFWIAILFLRSGPTRYSERWRIPLFGVRALAWCGPSRKGSRRTLLVGELELIKVKNFKMRGTCNASIWKMWFFEAISYVT